MKINFLKLDHIQICYPEGKEAIARQFYLDFLSLEEVPKPGRTESKGGFWAKISDIFLHFSKEQNHQISKRHPAFIVEDLILVRNYMESNNIRIQENNAFSNFGKNYIRFSFFDPFENRIELMQEVE